MEQFKFKPVINPKSKEMTARDSESADPDRFFKKEEAWKKGKEKRLKDLETLRLSQEKEALTQHQVE